MKVLLGFLLCGLLFIFWRMAMNQRRRYRDLQERIRQRAREGSLPPEVQDSKDLTSGAAGERESDRNRDRSAPG